MNTTWILILFYSALSIFLLSGVWFAIQAFRQRLTWGQARVMGVSATIFIWIEVIFYLAVSESLFGIISFITDLPFWVDMLVLFFIIILIGIIYWKLLRRSTFKPVLFFSMVLIPLGIPGVGIMAKLTKLSCLEITKVYGIYVVKNNKTICTIPMPLPKFYPTVIGPIKFANTHIVGRLGDRLTALRLTSIGFKKLNSKINNIHGIDGVYLEKFNNGKIKKLLIIENKVNKSTLNEGTPKQMSDQWIYNNANKLINSNKESLQKTGKLIIQTMNNNPKIIQRQLWNHNLPEGITIVKTLDKNADTIETIFKWKDNLIKNELVRWCKKKKNMECSKTVLAK